MSTVLGASAAGIAEYAAVGPYHSCDRPFVRGELARLDADSDHGELIIMLDLHVEMSLGADAKRLIIATASGTLGRAVKLKVISGGTSQPPAADRPSSNGGGRTRAEQDPVVRRMKDKFGAEIRTIIDYREKR